MQTRTFVYMTACILCMAGTLPADSMDSSDRVEAELPDPSLAGDPADSATREDEAALSVDELIEIALDRSPSVAALRARLEASKQRIAPAGALPDPMVEAMLQDINFPEITIGDEDMSMIGVEISQGLPYPGKRKARREAARAESAMNAVTIETLRRQVAANMRMFYARIYAIDQEIESLKTARELMDLLASTAGARYSAGQTEQEAMIKAQLSITRLMEREKDLHTERHRYTAAINRLMDMPGEQPLGRIVELPAVSLDAITLEELALANSSEVAEKRAAIEAAERRVDVAKLDLKPDFFAGAGAYARGEMDQVVTLRFGVELPIWSSQKQRPLKRSAEYEVEMAHQELREAEAMVRSEISRLTAEWNNSEEQIVLYEEGILPQTSAVLDAARSSYLAGRGDFSTVIEDFNLWLDARVELSRRFADRYSTWAEVESLITPLPSLQDEETGL